MGRDASKDPWEQILAKAGIAPESIEFVSEPIGPEIIREFVDPQLAIPIYSTKTYSNRFKFLSKYGLIPLRTGIGTAVLTKANLFLPATEKAAPQLQVQAEYGKIPVSLSSPPIHTEARYLAMAYETGVFNAAFFLPPSNKPKLGLFGKMNLPRAEIKLADDKGRIYPLNISNVQFDLDFSLETLDSVYLIEAKMGRAETFSALQLFYPYVLLAQLNSEKEIRTFLLEIDMRSESVMQYRFHEYCFRTPFVANSGELKQVVSVELKISNSLDVY